MNSKVMRVGIIGGTGIYDFGDSAIKIETGYGNVDVFYSKKGEIETFFLPRHGRGHGIPPHKINYKANIQALKNCKVERIIALSTVGSMRKEIKPGSIFIPSDFIDFTKRKATFFDDDVIHVDMSQPFCEEVRHAIIKSAKKIVEVFEGVYLATEGPRLETKAEIMMFSKFAHVVGMTLVPEVILAREKGICYASLCLVSNMAAGLQKELPADEIVSIYSKKKDMMLKIIKNAIKEIPKERKCGCGEAAIKGKIG